MTIKRYGRGWWAVVLVAMLMLSGCSADRQSPSAEDTITIGWTAWDDAEFVTRLARAVIEKHTDHHVRIKLAGIEQQYQGVAEGRYDAMLMAWLPDTHARYWADYRDQVVDLGTLYRGGQLGWAVPDYVPAEQLGSIADLADAEVADRLGHRIQGIDPGAGLMQLSEQAIAAYNLADRYQLVAADAHAMTGALAQAEQNRAWIVVTGWTPHWMFAKWRLRFLLDPKGALGTPQRVDALARPGFREDYPRVAAILSAMQLSLAELQAAMFEAEQTSYKNAVAQFMNQHQAQVRRWVQSADNE
ncbi:glycine betaine ABC transporter substrate-binding protein [Salinisphaera sp. SPP-AMP-43]|uniref:glycine betaine ABC transporter substrate-binding protein n=1 Tax=Salinisphaera sp. SPP-AMP-43 TaxID=3121288 RepID=UPI003C6E5F9E